MLRARQRLGKYRVDGRIGEGGFSVVFRAYDTIEGIQVALKLPYRRLFKRDAVEGFKKEVRIAANLDHPNILPIKTAMFIDRKFVIVYPLGEKAFADRLRNRITLRASIAFAEQMLMAVAHAHEHQIVHCDIKPENFIVFPGDRLRLTDFGIAKIAQETRTLRGAGTGTLGYLAPEQALGKPSFRSDVFALGLLLYRMFSGQLPAWPYDWPPPSIERLRQTFTPSFIAFLRRAMAIDERMRFADAVQMLAAFQRLKPNMLRAVEQRRKKKRSAVDLTKWQHVRERAFKRRFGRVLNVRHECRKCRGPMSEAMSHCPWCGRHRPKYEGPTRFPKRCRRCGRGMKLDWKYCGWCYGKRPEPAADRQYSDAAYVARCSSPACDRKDLLPFLRYCPWCNTKVKKKWKMESLPDRCDHCGWSVVKEFWDFCPWCGKRHERRKSRER